MLLKSLQTFTAGEVFQNFYVVAAASELSQIEDVLSPYLSIELQLIDENVLVPEFREHPTVGGWSRQQIIKLAISRIADTPYYTTFDCDVLCTRSLDLETLLPGGKALLQLGSKEICPNWWTSSARLLGLDPKMKEPGMQVTPAILSTRICGELLSELNRLGAPGGAFEYLMRPLDRLAWQRLTPGYKKKFRWTEYTLYYLFAEHRGLLQEHHVLCGTNEHPQLLIGDHGVWNTEDLASWQPEKVFAPEDPGLFCVVQSNTGVEPKLVWEKVSAFLSP